MRGKEIKLNISDKYSVSIGTVDEKNPKSVYIMISTWLTPKSDSEIDYSRVIFNMNKHLKSYVSNILNQDYFNPELTIIDLDMRQSGIKHGKRSYVSLEVTLYQTKNPLEFESHTLNHELNDIIDSILTDTFDSSTYFDFYKTKKLGNITYPESNNIIHGGYYSNEIIPVQPLGQPENTIDRWKALGLIFDDEIEFPKPICCYVKTVPNHDYVEQDTTIK